MSAGEKAPDDCAWAGCDAKAEITLLASRPCGHNTATKPASLRSCRQCADRQLAKNGGLATRETECEACGQVSLIRLDRWPPEGSAAQD